MQITLANLKDATAQQVFDQVKTHMLTQKAQSKTENDQCAYRGAEGKMCAAGCLISDAEYADLQIKGQGLDDGAGWNWGWLSAEGHVPELHESLISDLQIVHDQTIPDNWEVELDKVAITHGLV